MINKRLIGLSLTLTILTSLFPLAYAVSGNEYLSEFGSEVYEANLKLYNAHNRNEGYLQKACLTSDEWIDNENENITAKAAEITDGITDPYKKAKTIHDWMCDNVIYTSDLYIPEGKPHITSSGTLRDLRGNESGWAMLSVALMNASGIPARRAFGWARLPDGREADWDWYEAFADNRWIIIDSAYATIAKSNNDDYFDISIEELSKKHQIYYYSPSIARIIEGTVLIECGDDGRNLDGITEIASSAFLDNRVITDFVIPDGVTRVDRSAFWSCDYLTSIKFPDSVTEIGDYIFYGCSKLQAVVLSPGLTTIPHEAFLGCISLKEITLPYGVKTIGNSAFFDCWALKSVNIPTSVETIEACAFKVCSLTEIVIPPNVKEIGADAFDRKVTIIGMPGSAAESYARENGLQFKVLTLTARPTSSAVNVDGKIVAFDAYNISDNNFFKLRDLAYVLSDSEKLFEVTWDDATGTILLTSGKPYTPVGGELQNKGTGDKTPALTASKILFDGKAISLIAYNIDGNNYFRLRDIGQMFDFAVKWDGSRNTIIIDTSADYIP